MLELMVEILSNIGDSVIQMIKEEEWLELMMALMTLSD